MVAISKLECKGEADLERFANAWEDISCNTDASVTDLTKASLLVVQSNKIPNIAPKVQHWEWLKKSDPERSQPALKFTMTEHISRMNQEKARLGMIQAQQQMKTALTAKQKKEIADKKKQEQQAAADKQAAKGSGKGAPLGGPMLALVATSETL